MDYSLIKDEFLLYSFGFYIVALIVYLIFFPIKLWLKKRNKLSNRVNKTISIFFIVFPMLLSLYLVINPFPNKNLSKPETRAEKIEKIIKVKLPNEFKVKNDYGDGDWTGLNYYNYTILLDSINAREFTARIKESIYFIQTSYRRVKEDSLISNQNNIDTISPHWYKIPEGYAFHEITKQSKMDYRIEFDTVRREFSYNEVHIH